jgi:lipoteichoic acid synthase
VEKFAKTRELVKIRFTVLKNRFSKSENEGKTMSLYSNRFLIFFPISIIFLESVFKVSAFHEFFNIGILYMLLFSIPIGLLLYLLSTLMNNKVNRILSIVLTAILTLIYVVQIVYFQIFSTFLALFSINGTGQVLQFWKEVLIAAKNKVITIILLLLPLLFLIFIGKKLMPARKASGRMRAGLAGAMVCLQLVATLFVAIANKGELSSSFLYSKAIIPDLSVNRFGLLTTSRLDVKHLALGFKGTEAGDEGETNPPESAQNGEQSLPSTADKTPVSQNASPAGAAGVEGANSPSDVTDSEAGAEVNKEFNVMDIDFDSLIAGESNADIISMHKYFMSVEPTKKNKYTGMFKGKNLIMITAEGFSPYAVNKDLTPTLYKMSQEGFRFTNFYTPIWGVSTSDGEYVACNSLIPKSGVWSFYVSGRNYMPFCMGNQLKKLGYGTRAYHDHSYTYYHRDVSHPNMGYDFKAVGHGLDMTKSWPESDLEMIEKTADDYINGTPFHTYYMTVSGHLRYTFDGNAMSDKNKELVKDLPYSNAVKAYLACNIEFDRAMGELISRLEKAGIADDTLIAISPDHYPYGLTNKEISELAGHTVETNFELYKGIFILWSEGMTPVEISKPCASMDILPTLSNLMGVEYDSRLLMGKDILSDASPLVVFSNWSWLTDKARYNSKARKLIPSEGETKDTVDKQYRAEISWRVNNMFNYSSKILDTNYYSKVFKQP